MRILQVSAADVGGGAERVALDLHRSYLARGLDAWLAIGSKRTDSPNTLELSGERAAPSGMSSRLSRMATRFGRALRDPSYLGDRLRGMEDFSFPATRRLLELPPHPPDVLHLHNLHGGYFDLRELPRLSSAVPTAVTLHDTWLTSGHCAYALGCEGWRTGCGQCPDLDRPMALRRDTVAANWRRKRDIYRRSRLFVAAPSRWVLRIAEESILSEATLRTFLVPNGVDLAVFNDAGRRTARGLLGLPEDAFVITFSAANAEANPFKDPGTVREALPEIARRIAPKPVLFLMLGTSGDGAGETNVRMVPYLADPSAIARHLQAADVHVHMAHGENYPLAILEAEACGTPVVASDVGGIAETLAEGETGLLVPEGDAAPLADAVLALADDPARQAAMGRAAAQWARENASLEKMADGYLAMYEAMIEESGRAPSA